MKQFDPWDLIAVPVVWALLVLLPIRDWWRLNSGRWIPKPPPGTETVRTD